MAGRNQEPKMTEAARKAKNEYQRNWYRKNPGRRKIYIARYWNKKAQMQGAE